MQPRRAFVCLLLAACPSGDGATAASSTGEPGTSTPTTGETPTTDASSTGDAMAIECVAGGIGAAFSWATRPEPGVASCVRISDGSLAMDCTGDFSGIFTLMLANPEAPGLVVGEAYQVDYRVMTGEDDGVVGEWLRVRGGDRWYVVAGQGPTLAPPDAPDDWFRPDVEVAVVATDCAALACGDGSGDEYTPRAISFGQGDVVNTLAPGKHGGVPGEFGGESYQAAVSEARTGACQRGAAGASVDVLAYSVVRSGAA